MQLQEMITLIQTVSDSKLTEFSYEENGVKLFLKKKDQSQENKTICETQSCQNTNISSEKIAIQSSLDTAAEKERGKQITSPMVGTFYTAPSEGAEPYVCVGDSVKKGQVVGIVEAMKLINEIESPYDGVVEEIIAENKEMVGFGQVLIRLR